MRERELGGAADVVLGDLIASLERGQRGRRARADDVGSQAVHLEIGADPRDEIEHLIGERDGWHELARLFEAISLLLLARLPILTKACGI